MDQYDAQVYGKCVVLWRFDASTQNFSLSFFPLSEVLEIWCFDEAGQREDRGVAEKERRIRV